MMLVTASTAAPRSRPARIAASVSAVAADKASVVGGAAADDHDAAHPEQQVVVHFAQISEVHAHLADHALPQSVGDGVILLVDLLEHERLIPLLFGGGLVPVDLDDLVLDRLAVACEEFDALRR